jgi:acyl dehydratase
MRTFKSIDELREAVGTEIGVGEWLQIDQERINQFAEATGDHQWIHVDVERAKRESPFGAPIAHGFLTLSLLPKLRSSVFRVEGIKAGINYGLNKVRFVAPVPAGSRVRARVSLKSVEPSGDNRFLSCAEVVVELEGSERPACVAESLGMYVI